MNNSVLNGTGATECSMPMGHGVVMIILNVISSIFGSIGNSLVCATIYTTTGLQTMSNYFLMSLAVADLIVTVVAQPLLVAFLGGSLGGSCLEIIEFLFRLTVNFSSFSSIIHLCFISVDRCLMVTRPFRRIMTKMRSRIMLLVSWILPIVYGVLHLTVSKKATSMFTVVMMAICFVVTVVSYLFIIFQVRKQRQLKRSSIHVMMSNESTNKNIENRVYMMIGVATMGYIIKSILFYLLWLPHINSAALIIFRWACSLGICTSAISPWSLNYRIAGFRVAWRRIRS